MAAKDPMLYYNRENDSDGVITLVSMDIAFTNLFYPEPSIWCFPPDLAVDVMNEKSFEDLEHKYLYNWMKPSQHLHYNKAILKLANSNYMVRCYKLLLEMGDWHVMDIHDIPNCVDSNNTSAWVINWLQLQDDFSMTIDGQLKDHVVRGKIAMSLVTSTFNVLKRQISKDACEWLRLRST
ncbi:hypothetical protein PIB30_087890 [Stylosanthes scabra]|uniref:Uncharacterized protein n=1 Tax=Stylosanthes scabra TaxID=79078 RepID=A0ABU6RU60_9FABA|nr:hypothetical protein [Stylosanthes scabra]